MERTLCECFIPGLIATFQHATCLEKFKMLMHVPQASSVPRVLCIYLITSCLLMFDKKSLVFDELYNEF